MTEKALMLPKKTLQFGPIVVKCHVYNIPTSLLIMYRNLIKKFYGCED